MPRGQTPRRGKTINSAHRQIRTGGVGVRTGRGRGDGRSGVKFITGVLNKCQTLHEIVSEVANVEKRRYFIPAQTIGGRGRAGGGAGGFTAEEFVFYHQAKRTVLGCTRGQTLIFPTSARVRRYSRHAR